MKVYDLGNTQWKQLTPTTSQQANIDTVAGISSNVTTVANNDSNITAVAGTCYKYKFSRIKYYKCK